MDNNVALFVYFTVYGVEQAK